MSARRCSGERGASLVIVLAIAIALGLFIAAIGSQGSAGVLSGQAVKTQRGNLNGLQGAIDGAINYLHVDATRGRVDNPPCNGGTVFNVAGVPVTCIAEITSGVPIEGPNTPQYALLTTSGLSGYPGGAGTPGISTSGGNNALLIGGAVASNSGISVPKGMVAGLNAAGPGLYPVNATGCSGTILAVPLSCNLVSPVAADPGGAVNVDPSSGKWASPVTSVPAAGAVLCNGSTSVATMTPGSYFDLSALTTAIGSCSIIWMQPGSYYFDFDFANAANAQWSIAKTLVGGTARGWNPASSNQLNTVNGLIDADAQSATAPAHPSACNDASAGVHLVFAETSRIDIAGNGRIEVCAPPNATTQQIALYGRKSSQTAPATVTPPNYAPTTATLANPSTMGSPSANVLSINGVINNPPNGAPVPDKNGQGTVTLTGYGLSGIPAGSTLNSVNLRIAHAEDTSLTFNVTVAAGSTPLCSTGTGITQSATLHTDTVSCASNVKWATPAAPQVTYTVTRPNSNGTTNVKLDGIELVVTYTPPYLKAETPGTTLLNMSTGGGNKGEILVWGTVYAPLAVLNIDFKNNSAAFFTRGGVIDRFLAANVPPAQTFGTFGLPSSGSYTDRFVTLTATLGSNTLTANVWFQDNAGGGDGGVWDPVITVRRWYFST